MSLWNRFMTRHTEASRPHRQEGWISIEIVGAMVVLAVAGVSFTNYYLNYQSNVAASVIGDHLKRITTATENYAKANWNDLINDAAGGGASNIEYADLSDEGYLPDNFNLENRYGQTYTIKAVSLKPDTLSVFVVGEGGQISSNGALSGADQNLVNNIIPKAAQYAGIMAGYIPNQELPNANPTTLEGPDGAWSFDLSSHPELDSFNVYQGSLASIIHMESGAINNDYLYRSDVGIPELNRMETDLDMHGNNILDAGTVLARDVVIDDVRVDGTVPATVSRGVYTMTRLAPNETIVQPDCRAPGATATIFTAVDSSPVGGAPGAGINVSTTSGNITGQVFSVRTRAITTTVSSRPAWRVLMDVYMAGGTAGSGRWYTIRDATGAQYESSIMVGTKCS